jgi:hypothetical protein
MFPINVTERITRAMIYALVATVAATFIAAPVHAQQTPAQKHDSIARADSIRKAKPGMPGMKMPAEKSVPGLKTPATKPMPGMKATTPMRAGDTAKMGGMSQMKSMIPEPLGVSMERMGSGTTWIPDAISLPSRHFTKGAWDFMLHGFVFAQYDRQNGPRGDSQFGSLNWGMFMASHELAGGRFQARTMLSLDPATVTARGYPLLLQSGESYRGQPLHDRQHPHDFWMELGALYERPITNRLGILVYAAPSGEPALGPVAFMHRPSAMDNPAAPIAHHWQDATHVSFGVITAGLFSHDWKLEGSVFNGREPDEHRWDFDPIRFDSYSGRLSFNPTRTWSLSVGYGYMKSMEALDPEMRMHRVTASAMHGAPIGSEGQWASTLIWGANTHSSNPGLLHSVTAETEAILDRDNTIFGRAELVQKTAEDLVLPDGSPPRLTLIAGALASGPEHFNVGSLQLGYIRELKRFRAATIGLGAVGMINVVPSLLENAYGSRTPLGSMIFLRLRPFHAHAGGMNEPTPMKSMHAELDASQ